MKKELKSYASDVIRSYDAFMKDPTTFTNMLHSIEKMKAFVQIENENNSERRQLRLFE